jgi:hypothetical protein
VTEGTNSQLTRRTWGAAGLLKVMLAAQCALAFFVVAGDVPEDLLGGLLGSDRPAIPMDVPVSPGNQTRRFEPNRVPFDLPADPNLPSGEGVPPRLEFVYSDTGDRAGTVLLNGSIVEGDAERFAKWLDERPTQPSGFSLNSPGGDVDEALQIGRIVRATELPVSVLAGAFCFSACPYILAGGMEREVSRNGFIGVHQHYFGENTLLPAFLLVSDVQSGQAQVMTYLAEMGIDPMLVAKALMTPPDDIYILMPEELVEFQLSTVTTD